MSTERLYLKRVVDRENQRASRARKKDRIQELEEEVSHFKKRPQRSEDMYGSCSLVNIPPDRHRFDGASASLREPELAHIARDVTGRDPSTGLMLELPLVANDSMLEDWSDGLCMFGSAKEVRGRVSIWAR
jgi:hypothetical protein